MYTYHVFDLAAKSYVANSEVIDNEQGQEHYA